jgi:hypothetical protein
LVSYPFWGDRVSLLAVEEEGQFKFWLLFVLENNDWVIAREFQVQLYILEDDSMEEEAVDSCSGSFQDE